ncbi:unnamed protein product [Soboliphyme baturini]|uniref:Uncharacterized protein n=1 Tax=Soboliphyme baturini TaxID=241478 RepID=A0A183JA15_9BILA|nr:unnamed protein product [Soboliphyme baturini]
MHEFSRIGVKWNYCDSPPEEPSMAKITPNLFCNSGGNLLENLVERVIVDEGLCKADVWRQGSGECSGLHGKIASGSSPESSGSGPSYYQINWLENVGR